MLHNYKYEGPTVIKQKNYYKYTVILMTNSDQHFWDKNINTNKLLINIVIYIICYNLYNIRIMFIILCYNILTATHYLLIVLYLRIIQYYANTII